MLASTYVRSFNFFHYIERTQRRALRIPFSFLTSSSLVLLFVTRLSFLPSFLRSFLWSLSTRVPHPTFFILLLVLCQNHFEAPITEKHRAAENKQRRVVD